MLKLHLLSGTDPHPKTIFLDGATAYPMEKCYGRTHCVLLSGFNRLQSTKRFFDYGNAATRDKWLAALTAAIKKIAQDRTESEKKALRDEEILRAARSVCRRKNRTLESFKLWHDEYRKTPMFKMVSVPRRRWWLAMAAVACAVFRDREERVGYTSLALIELQKKFSDDDAKSLYEIKLKARRILRECLKNKEKCRDVLKKNGASSESGASRSRGSTARTKKLEAFRNFLHSERVLNKLTQTLETIRCGEKDKCDFDAALRGLWVARCVRSLAHMSGALQAILGLSQERASLRRLLAGAMFCRIPLLTTLVLEILSALALLPGREGRDVANNVLEQVDKSAKWGQPLCSQFMMRASPEALKWSSAAPRNPPPFAALATLLHDTPEHNCCRELRSAVVALFAALCRCEATRSGAQWMQARIFHACRSALNVSIKPKLSRKGFARMSSLSRVSRDDDGGGDSPGATNEALLRVRQRRSSISLERSGSEEFVVPAAPQPDGDDWYGLGDDSSTPGRQQQPEMHPCPSLRALLDAPSEVEEYDIETERLFRIQLEQFLDGWDIRELDEADECDSLPIGSAERNVLLCERIKRSALLLGRYANIDDALHAFGIDLEHAAFMPIQKLAPRAIILDNDETADSRKINIDLNATINSICKLHKSSIEPGQGVQHLVESLRRDGTLVYGEGGRVVLKGGSSGSLGSLSNGNGGAPTSPRAAGSNSGIMPVALFSGPSPQNSPMVRKVKVRAGPALKDEPKFSKYFKMIKMHVPRLAVEAKMAQEGLDPTVLDLDPNSPAPAGGESEADGDTASLGGFSEGVPLENDPTYAKYFKMLKVRIPRPSVEAKMRSEGLDPAVLDLDRSLPLPASMKPNNNNNNNGNNNSTAAASATAEATTEDDDKEEEVEEEVVPSGPPPVGCQRVPRHRLRRVFWDVVESETGGTMWEVDKDESQEIEEEDDDERKKNLYSLSDEGLEELEMIFGTTSRRSSVSKADATAEKAAAKKHKYEDELRRSTRVDSRGDPAKNGRPLVAEALGEKRAFALNLLYGSLRMSSEVCVAAVASLDPDNSVFVKRLPQLGTLYNLISRKEDLKAIEIKAIDTGVLDEATKTLMSGVTSVESLNLDPLSTMMVSLIDRARRPRAKVQALWLYATVRDRAAELTSSISRLQDAARAVRSSSSLQKLLRVVLSITNFVNHGSDRANKSGVRLSSLLKLQTTRTTKADSSTKNLLQFIVRHSGVSSADLKREMSTSLLRSVHTGPTRNSLSSGIDQLRSERDDAVAERGVLSREATTQKPGVDARRVAVAAAAAARMATMVADVDDELRGLESSYASMDNAVDETLKFYGEPTNRMGCGEAVDWFRTLDTFIKQYETEYTAHREHLARRERREELARKKHARESLMMRSSEDAPLTATKLSESVREGEGDDLAGAGEDPRSILDDINFSLEAISREDGTTRAMTFNTLDDEDDDDDGRGAFGGDDDITICAQCRACNNTTTPGAFAKGQDPCWYCADCWYVPVIFRFSYALLRRYEFSFHNADWKDDFGEETTPLVSNG